MDNKEQISLLLFCISMIYTASTCTAADIHEELSNYDIDEELLSYAANSGDYEKKIAELINQGTDPNATDPITGDTPLIRAVKYNCTKTTEILLTKSPSKVDHQNNKGNTALIIAGQQGNWKLAQILIITGRANVTIKNKKGLTASQTATIYHHAKTARNIFAWEPIPAIPKPLPLPNGYERIKQQLKKINRK